MKLKGFCLAVLLLTCGLSANAKHIATKGFLFGFATSFNDSTIYFTSIQEVDSVWIDLKSNFLYSKENYSYQLRDYLKDQGLKTPTCATFFSLKRKDIEKKFLALKKRYQTSKKQNYIIKYLSNSDFIYKAITLEDEESENGIEQQVLQKKNNKKNKQK